MSPSLLSALQQPTGPYGTPVTDLMALPGSAWLLLSFSPFPVRHPGADHGTRQTSLCGLLICTMIGEIQLSIFYSKINLLVCSALTLVAAAFAIWRAC